MQKKSSLHNAMLYEKLPGRVAKCGICLRRCVIPDGKSGTCMTRINIGGEIFSTVYGMISSLGIDPIEKKPVYHYLPGTLCFSIGTYGCNFRCKFCQNWEIAYADGTDSTMYDYIELSPAQAVKLAIEKDCYSIAWTYNEPSIWFEYTLDCAKEAHKQGIKTIYVTNGYMTPEALDIIGPYLDVFRVDIKSFSNNFYQELIKLQDMSQILANTVTAKEKWNMHVETVTNIIPRWNDSDENISLITKWIYDNLGESTPWHATRFFPHASMTDVPSTPIATLMKAKQIACDNGLKYIYIGNANTKDNNTQCPNCKKIIIERNGYSINTTGLAKDSKCVYCGKPTGIINS